MPRCRWFVFAFLGLLLSRAAEGDPPSAANLRLVASPPSLWQREMATLPAEIRTLAEEMQGKKAAEMYSLISKRFGPAARDIGSGVVINEWDVAGGVLTLQSGCGPTFTPNGKPEIWLLKTTNLVKSNLYADYEMTTLPQPRNMFWLGSLTLSPILHYHYKDNGQFLSERAGQKANFFLLHHEGTLRVEYPVGITASSHLEDIADGATVANLTFIAHNQHDRKTFRIITRRSSRTLVFSGDGELLFRMERAWQSDWN